MAIIIEFFPITELDPYKYYELKSFIAKNTFFSKDTVIDIPTYRVFTDPIGATIIVRIINNDKLITITWQDGKCKELEKCIDMMNDLIPKERRDMFKIYYKYLIPENK